VTFSSVPQLPQDEVVAQLLFGRSITELSPFQLAQLAAAVAELAGGGGPSILDQLRAGLGFDDIDILTEPDGGTAVQVGKYISDNVYLGVRVGEETTGVTINLDVTKNLKVRGEATERASSLGIFYEREY
jgi:translocation and assembly module TamB